MRRARTLALCATIVFGLAAPTADAAEGNLTMRSKITSFSAQNGQLVANGTLTGRFSSGGQVSRDTARVRFRVAQRRGRRCDVLTLRLEPLTLELLGVRAQTSRINLEVYARRGAVLGNLFCALSRARVRLPRIAAAMNRRLKGRSLPVFGASTKVRSADHQGTCQVLRLVLGPLHLNLLGLHVELYGQNRRSPVVVTIDALRGHGVLGDLLCEVAGGPQ